MSLSLRMAEPKKRTGFTLVELLVVITIIGILIALLLPAVQAAREAARRMQCANNVKQLALALHGYHQAIGVFPPAMQCDSSETPATTVRMRANWVIAVLPYLEQQGLYDAFDFSVPISNAANREARGQALDVMTCPTDSASRLPYQGSSTAEGANWARGNYGANCGNGLIYPLGVSDASGASCPGWTDKRTRGVMGVNCAVRIDDITDGTSNTILLAEMRVGVSQRDRRGCWALGGAASSALVGFGIGDSYCPNPTGDESDDIVGCTYLRNTDPGANALISMGMSCFGSTNTNDQGAARSMHPGGLQVAMADGSVCFINDFVQSSPSPATYPWPEDCVWTRLIASADGYPVSGGSF